MSFMWSARSEQLARGVKSVIDLDSSPVSFAELLRRWQSDADCRSFFTRLLADAPFAAFRWETPPVNAVSANRPFEFVLLNSPELSHEPDPSAFSTHLSAGAAGEGVVAFPNLGRDAILIVPCPLGPVSAYGHIAAFVREAPNEQKHSLWKLIGRTMEEQIGPAPVWLSTAGAGVPWLHVRLDKRPKYYGHRPYRDLP
jgi:hypothetical protein